MMRSPVPQLSQRGRVRLLGVVVIAIAALLLAGAATNKLKPIFSRPDTMTVSAVFRDAQHLKATDPVRIDGVAVGKVTDVKLNEDGRSATVKMKVERDAGPLYGDAKATLRWRLLLGSAFVVDLDPGGSAAGELRGATIAQGRTESQVELEDVLTVARGNALTGLKALPQGLAQALADPEQPARLLDTVARVAPDVAGGAEALRGQVQDTDLRGLVRNTAAALQVLNADPGRLQALVEGAAATVTTTARRGAEISQTLRSAPGVMTRVNATLGDLNGTLRLANPLVSDLQDPADDVDPTLRRLTPVVSDADTLLQRARPLVRDLRPAAKSLASLSSRAPALLDELQPSVDRLEKTILPYLDQVDPQTNLTTAETIGPALASVGNATGQVDDNGHFFRFPATVGSSSVAGLPCTEYIGNPEKTATLIECQALNAALKKYLGYSPLDPKNSSSKSTSRRTGSSK